MDATLSPNDRCLTAGSLRAVSVEKISCRWLSNAWPLRACLLVISSE
jgi:hypothetical protein